jgi:DNA-binding protein H-NS
MNDFIARALRPIEDQPLDIPLAELASELQQLKLARARLERRERVLVQTLAESCQRRLDQMVRLPEGARLELTLLSTLQSVAQKPMLDPSKLAQSFIRRVPIKYRHPEQPSLVWSGRGKVPRWVAELQQQGRLEEARLTAA